MLECTRNRIQERPSEITYSSREYRWNLSSNLISRRGRTFPTDKPSWKCRRSSNSVSRKDFSNFLQFVLLSRDRIEFSIILFPFFLYVFFFFFFTSSTTFQSYRSILFFSLCRDKSNDCKELFFFLFFMSSFVKVKKRDNDECV